MSDRFGWLLCGCSVVSGLGAAMNANEVKALRLLAGWTQDNMAELLGMSKRTYMRAEQGERAFTRPEQLMLLLWWRGLRTQGLKVQVYDDPTHSQWWVMSELGGRKWRALGPYDTRRDADATLRWLDKEGL